MVIVIIGILAVTALPRLDASVYKSAAFHDSAIATLRYAQKTATSHRRLVCVSFTASSITLQIAKANPANTCDENLNLAGRSTNVLQSSDTVNAIFNPVPANFNFLPDGTGADRSLAISGLTTITIVGATGHVQ
jgi:MSHA pilin protein MshC